MKRYAITEEQRDEWAMILKYLNEWVQTVNGSPSKYCTDIISGLRSLPELPGVETDAPVDARMLLTRVSELERENGKLNATMDFMVTRRTIEEVHEVFFKAFPNVPRTNPPSPAEPKTCIWTHNTEDSIFYTGCNRDYSDVPETGICECGKPITIKPGEMK